MIALVGTLKPEVEDYETKLIRLPLMFLSEYPVLDDESA